ncbi:signal peptidase I [Francisella tularensis]|uniref:Signal peptidase I n=3 Tax=Francisella tularensis TaxID=263 RepID=Q5NER2_FRATT|nr:signal peptidase I [Francisella tularensis]ADA79203.1 signal peptidase I [Francisella tularensis subsp. tularensis NE061598]AFB79570.1 Signal peptidase I [Francisella tularensis subsp. tularensis TIGB03]AFB81114.1 Signal peptidase I [Francisella tularensis subsp. tularensis TI0902]AJI69351.1 signal peptidase I [Francisella tularensis subsp. tularensis SCHU S4]AJI71342.1 signal peptidase I [Francisella tularensis subsp. tularensis]
MEILNYILNLGFTFWLLFLTIASGLIYIIDFVFFQKSRLAAYTDELKGLSKKQKRQFYKDRGLKAPFIADQARSLFSVFFVVFLLRTFLIGNFLIPTASMTPTLPVGDFIFVNKTAYGIRAPFTNETLIKVGEPKRGDIVVFHFPVNPNVDFVKRVIGLPGDVISYKDKMLTINGKKLEYTNCNRDAMNYYNQSLAAGSGDTVCTENLDGVKHEVDWIESIKGTDFENLRVPAGQYFVMGDNRDNSEDSRYWGFVPDKDLVGKAKVVWMSWDKIDKKVRWDEIGKVF